MKELNSLARAVMIQINDGARQSHLSGVTGMTVANPLHIGAISSDLTAEQAEKIFVNVGRVVGR